MVRRGKGESVDGNGKKREGEGGMGRRGKGEWEEEGRGKVESSHIWDLVEG